MSTKLTPPRTYDARVTWEVRKARRPYRCDDYPQSHVDVIKQGDQYIVCTEFPGGESGYADAAGRPVRLRICLDHAPHWAHEQLTAITTTQHPIEGPTS